MSDVDVDQCSLSLHENYLSSDYYIGNTFNKKYYDKTYDRNSFSLQPGFLKKMHLFINCLVTKTNMYIVLADLEVECHYILKKTYLMLNVQI